MRRFHHLWFALLMLLFITWAEASTRSNQLQYLMNLSMKEWDSKVLIQACSESKNVENCVKFGGAIRAQEGGYGTNHPFWMLRQPSRYKGKVKEKTTAEYVELRVWSFNRHWWRYNTAQAYLTRSKYCTSGCEHWIPNVTRFIAGYETWVIPEPEWPVWTPPNEPTDLPAIWEPIQTWCRWIATAKEGQRIQVDMHFLEKFASILFNWVVGKDKKAMIFICDK